MLYLTDNVYRCNAAWNVFNQPLSWDTSRVTNMGDMFTVRCSPRPVCHPTFYQRRCTGKE